VFLGGNLTSIKTEDARIVCPNNRRQGLSRKLQEMGTFCVGRVEKKSAFGKVSPKGAVLTNMKKEAERIGVHDWRG